MACPRHFDDRDDAAFELAVARHGGFQNARHVYASQLQMDKGDWDEGWGWNNPSTDRAVAKMIASCYLLERGVGAYPESVVSTWTKATVAAAVPLRDPISPLKVKTLQGVTLKDGRQVYREHSHAFISDTAGSLQHYYEAITTDAASEASIQFVGENVTALVGAGLQVGSICAMADDPVPNPTTGEGWACAGDTGRPIRADAAFDRTALLWVFGRSPAGEVIVHYSDWHAAAPQWKAFSLATVKAIADPANAAGRDEVPAIIKRGSTSSHRIDIVVRSGFALYHYWREGSNADPTSHWLCERLGDASVEARARPTMLPAPDGFHVLTRNQNAAVIHYRYVFGSQTPCCWNPPFPTFMPCYSTTAPSLVVRNVDNEAEGVAPDAIVIHNNVSGPVVAVALTNGNLHLVQRKTDSPLGLLHYVLDGPTWRRGRWWGNEDLTGEPCAILTSENELRPGDFPFELYVTGAANNLYCFLPYQDGTDWLRNDITQDAVQIDRPDIAPATPVRGRADAVCTRFEEWPVRNVFARTTTSTLARHVWVNRAGWKMEALPSTGWRSEVLPDSNGSLGTPAALDFERILDVFTFSATNFVRHRLTRDRPWHASSDYFHWVDGDEFGFEFEPEDADDSNATSTPAPFWNANMKCPGFDLGTADRAATILHESTHLNKHFRGTVAVWQHEEKNGEDADEWFFHTLWAIGPGELEPEDHQHSMNQMEVEFMTDLGEFPSASLPLSIWSDATAIAQENMVVHILDIPPWSPGEPRPI